jgi:diaminopimelate decarboxylase
MESPFSTVTVPSAGGWWARNDLHYDADGHLRFAGHRVEELASAYGTPSYVYSGERIQANVLRLRFALNRLKQPSRLFYAMKSNRFPGVLRLLHTLGVGLDLCSPGELYHAKSCGFEESELSFTAGSLSQADYEALAGAPNVWINADSLEAIRRLGRLCPGREIGLRINPSAGLGYAANEKLLYAGTKPTKFGIYLDRFPEALELARKLGLRVTGLHCHAGCGFLSPQLPALSEVLKRVGVFLDQAPGITRLNLGGGLGIPLRASDQALDLEAWADAINDALAKREGLALAFEPGDYLVKDAGILLTEVTQVEEKGATVFVGVNAGFNVHPEPVFYHLPLEPVPALRRRGAQTSVSIAGNINEAMDLWAEDVPLPPLEPGDTLCFLNAGGYGASMSSLHCLRNEMKEHLLPEPSGNPASAEKTTSPEELDSSNKRAWDKLYGSVSDLVWGSSPLPFLEGYRKEFSRAVSSPWRLLDAGAGEGRNLPFLISIGATETHALDASMNALGKIPPALIARVKSHCADLANTGYASEYFDGITLLDVVETLPNSVPVLRELFRILKPGGILLCNIPGFDDGVAGTDMRPLGNSAFLYRDRFYYEFRTPAEAEKLLRGNGFEIVRLDRSEWDENAHPGYRSTTHRHISLVLLAQKPPLG